MRAYVLAGGASQRMGSDKARLPHQGWPTAVHLLGLLEEAGFQPALIRRAADGLPWQMPDGREVEVVRESEGDRHPLWGVCTALDHAGGSVVVVPCDLPGLTVQALQVLHTPGRLHPLVAHVPWELRDAVEAGARDGRSVRSVLDLPQLPIDPEIVRERNHPEIWPAQRLWDRLAWMPDSTRQAVMRQECARLRARGVVDPFAELYARRPEDG